jgi:hypothetical protein
LISRRSRRREEQTQKPATPNPASRQIGGQKREDEEGQVAQIECLRLVRKTAAEDLRELDRHGGCRGQTQDDDRLGPFPRPAGFVDAEHELPPEAFGVLLGELPGQGAQLPSATATRNASSPSGRLR